MTSEEENLQIECEVCGQSFTHAYWDPELEWYIYLADTKICPACRPSKVDQLSSECIEKTEQAESVNA